MLKERSFYNMNNSCLFWEKRSFSLSILAQDAVKNRSTVAGKQTQTASNPESLLPFLLNPNLLERSF